MVAEFDERCTIPARNILFELDELLVVSLEDIYFLAGVRMKSLQSWKPHAIFQTVVVVEHLLEALKAVHVDSVLRDGLFGEVFKALTEPRMHVFNEMARTPSLPRIPFPFEKNIPHLGCQSSTRWDVVNASELRQSLQRRQTREFASGLGRCHRGERLTAVKCAVMSLSRAFFMSEIG
ncbi:hypothetical protein AC1031_003575 [Aphanomyces cochlioides]|nr:hypothetical protein AC1031_003575 [Aphanomyces cochlioides]